MINKIYQIDLRLFGIATHEPKSMKRIKQKNGDKTFEPINTRVKSFSAAEKSFVSEMRQSTKEAERSKL